MHLPVCVYGVVVLLHVYKFEEGVCVKALLLMVTDDCLIPPLQGYAGVF